MQTRSERKRALAEDRLRAVDGVLPVPLVRLPPLDPSSSFLDPAPDRASLLAGVRSFLYSQLSTFCLDHSFWLECFLAIRVRLFSDAELVSCDRDWEASHTCRLGHDVFTGLREHIKTTTLSALPPSIMRAYVSFNRVMFRASRGVFLLDPIHLEFTTKHSFYCTFLFRHLATCWPAFSGGPLSLPQSSDFCYLIPICLHHQRQDKWCLFTNMRFDHSGTGGCKFISPSGFCEDWNVIGCHLHEFITGVPHPDRVETIVHYPCYRPLYSGLDMLYCLVHLELIRRNGFQWVAHGDLQGDDVNSENDMTVLRDVKTGWWHSLYAIHLEFYGHLGYDPALHDDVVSV
mmetsp:Transcript_43006/g.111153  ORF Transcript_43006/g.111153 Transcript_43006/m.111153 type:complete len:345 (-) Transcript_43006:1370-2404(-)